MTREELIRETSIFCAGVPPNVGNRISVQPEPMLDTVTWRFLLDGVELGALLITPVSGALPSEKDDYEVHWRVSQATRQLKAGEGGELLSEIVRHWEEWIRAVGENDGIEFLGWPYRYNEPPEGEPDKSQHGEPGLSHAEEKLLERIPQGREREIARLWLSGSSAPEIAGTFHLAPHTIGNTIWDLRKRFGAEVVPYKRPRKRSLSQRKDKKGQKKG
jgi:hypothetical protein